MVVERSTKPVKLKVEALPAAAEAPGAVGRFKVETTAEPRSLRLGDAATVRFRVEGTGNLKWVEKGPDLVVPGAKVFPPQVKSNLQPRTDGFAGSKTWEYVVVPETSGRLTIPALPFTWFDPAAGRVASQEGAPIDLEVQEAANVAGPPAPSAAVVPRGRGNLALRDALDSAQAPAPAALGPCAGASPCSSRGCSTSRSPCRAGWAWAAPLRPGGPRGRRCGTCAGGRARPREGRSRGPDREGLARGVLGRNGKSGGRRRARPGGGAARPRGGPPGALRAPARRLLGEGAGPGAAGAGSGGTMGLAAQPSIGAGGPRGDVLLVVALPLSPRQTRRRASRRPTPSPGRATTRRRSRLTRSSPPVKRAPPSSGTGRRPRAPAAPRGKPCGPSCGRGTWRRETGRSPASIEEVRAELGLDVAEIAPEPLSGGGPVRAPVRTRLAGRPSARSSPSWPTPPPASPARPALSPSRGRPRSSPSSRPPPPCWPVSSGPRRSWSGAARPCFPPRRPPPPPRARCAKAKWCRSSTRAAATCAWKTRRGRAGGRSRRTCGGCASPRPVEVARASELPGARARRRIAPDSGSGLTCSACSSPSPGDGRDPVRGRGLRADDASFNRLVRAPRATRAAGSEGRLGRDGLRWGLHASGERCPPGWPAIRPSTRAGRVLPCHRGVDAQLGFRHQDRSVDAAGRLEREVPGSGQRRVRRSDRLSRDGKRRRPGVCHGRHRHGSLRRGDRRELGPRTSRESDRLRVPRDPLDDADRQAGHRSVLRPKAAAFVLRELLERGPAGAHGSAALSGRLRRHPRGGARQCLDAPAHQSACGRAGDHSGSGELRRLPGS